MRYRFKRPVPPHAKGDPVPDSYTPGVIRTMLDYGRIEAVPAADVAPAEKVCVPEADKMLRGTNPRVKRKGVGA